MLLATSRWLACALLGALLFGCPSWQREFPARTALRAPAGEALLAGAASVDITPRPGLGTAGHGPSARRAIGHRGRLRCRALYLRDRGGESAALAVCDLAYISQALHRSVAERLLAEGLELGPDRLVLAATHTHAGFGHYLEAESYRGLFSGQYFGFDPEVLEFVSARISAAILEAHAGAAPARLGWGVRDLSAHALTRNRSVLPHCRNAAPMGGSASSCAEPSPDPLREVLPTLSLLRVDRIVGEGARPLALFSFFPIHSTAVPNTNSLYHADILGYAASGAEARIRRRVGEPDFIAAAACGAAGDAAPNVSSRSWPEARRVGEAIAEQIDVLHAEIVTASEIEVRRAYVELSLPGAEGGGARLCEEAEIGSAAAGGSEGVQTDFARFWPFREGTMDPSRTDCQGPKQAILPAGLPGSGGMFPRVAPLHALRVGDGLILATPFELTTTTGLRLRARIEDRRPGSRPIVILGLSNAYLQYVATREEFALQHYEGASTLYGPGTAQVLIAAMEGLVDALEAPQGPQNASGPLSLDVPCSDLRPGIPRSCPAPRLRGGGAHPGSELGGRLYFEAGREGCFPERAEPLVRLERREHGAWRPLLDGLDRPVDDRHPDFSIRLGTGSCNGRFLRPLRRCWIASYNPAEAPAVEVRFVIEWPGRAPIAGPSFRLRH